MPEIKDPKDPSTRPSMTTMQKLGSIATQQYHHWSEMDSDSSGIAIIGQALSQMTDAGRRAAIAWVNTRYAEKENQTPEDHPA